MKLSAPTKWVFIVAVVLGVLALLGQFTTIPFISAYSFWTLFVGFVLLVAGSLFKGL